MFVLVQTFPLLSKRVDLCDCLGLCQQHRALLRAIADREERLQEVRRQLAGPMPGPPMSGPLGDVRSGLFQAGLNAIQFYGYSYHNLKCMCGRCVGSAPSTLQPHLNAMWHTAQCCQLPVPCMHPTVAGVGGHP